MTISSTLDSTVNSFYLAFYGRPADPDGLKFWSQQLAANNGDMGAIVDFFAASEEARVRFGTDSVADRISEIYQQLFNRAPDTAGMAFWTAAIESGHASLADVAISILHGAQGSDASLSQLRQQAVEAFTAEVEASGSQYAGYASIEAARILVRAVTADATAADLNTLVKAAVSFADTATKTPQVVEAIAVNTTLLALFDTTRGKSEPVGLAQALADTAKAAAGDPVTLESLLRGGGMDKVLKVMPANASLKDVVDALAEGGLPAAVEVVYPSTPSVPSAPSYKLSFLGVTQGQEDEHGKADTKIDNVTREKTVDVTFGYRGNDLASGQKYEYRINGGEWTSAKLEVDTAANTVVLQQVDLTQGQERMTINSIGTMGALPTADLVSNIELRAVRSDGSTIAAVQQQIVYDHHAAMPVVSVAPNKLADYFDGVHATGVPALVVEGIETGATVEYQLVPRYGRLGDGGAGSWSTKQPDFDEDGEYTVLVRQIDASGNISDHRQFTFTLDREAPKAPTVALQADTGIPGDNVTDIAKIKITGLEASTNTAWEYRVGDGEWKFGERNDGTGSAVLDLETPAAGQIAVQVRQFDAAGHVGDASEVLSFTYDATPPVYTIAFAGVEQGKNDAAPDDLVTNVKSAEVTFTYTGELAEGLRFEYTIDGQNWLTTGIDASNGVVTIVGVDLTAGVPVGAPPRIGTLDLGPLENLATTVQLRIVDANDHVFAQADEKVVLDRFAEVPDVGLMKNSAAPYLGQASVGRTNVVALDIDGLEEGAIAQYANMSNSPNMATWLDTLPDLQDGTYTFLVRQRDAAGNASATQEITFTLDRSAPGAPTVRLAADTGSDTKDGVTNNGNVIIENLVDTPDTGWQYSTNGGATWVFGGVNAITGQAEFDLASLHASSGTFQVRQIDAAGNTGDAAELDFTLLTGKPSWTPDLVGLSNELPGVLVTAQNKVDITFSVGAHDGDTVAWRLKGGNGSWTTVSEQDIVEGKFTIGDIELASADQTVELRVTDRAGNEGDIVSHLIDGPFKLPSLEITKHQNGIIVTSPIAGKILIGGVEAFATDGKGAIAGSSMVAEQDQRLVGTVSVVAEDGSTAFDESGVEYTLGGSGVDSVTGSNVWGFGGADILYDTGSADYLNGGAGDDMIYSYTGADTLVGGTGADRIFLGNDDAVRTVIFEGGDTIDYLTGDGQATAVMDMVLQPKDGDVLQVGPVFTAAPVVLDTYLSNAAVNQVAIIRGTSSGGAFYADANGPLYMVQWSDGMHVNSILVSDYYGQRLGLTIDHVTGRMTVDEAPPPPVASSVEDVKFHYSADASMFSLEGVPSSMVAATGAGNENGLLDKSGLTLSDLRSMQPLPTAVDYTSGPDFGVGLDGRLKFNDVLQAGLYEMEWKDATIATYDGYFSADKVQFAGGADGNFFHHHFVIDRIEAVSGDVPKSFNNESVAYIATPASTGIIFTGGNNDVIVDTGTTLSIGCTDFSSDYHDLILGFDSGDDVFFFEDGGATMVDRSRNGNIEWASHDAGGKAVLAASTEAAMVTVSGPVGTSQQNVILDATYATLNASIDATGKKPWEGLLILAKNEDGDAGALFWWFADNNGIVEKGELLMLAMFSDGAPLEADIKVIGSIVDNGGIPGG